MYSRLKSDLILSTMERLEARIAERFPHRGLHSLARELTAVGRSTSARAAGLRKPYLWLRAAVGLVLALGVSAQAFSFQFFKGQTVAGDALSLVQGLEASVNLLVLMGAGLWFLATLEERLKRQRALAILHSLRSLAHIVDMHQLTKDPTVVLSPAHRPTASSPERSMSRYELTRYLEYCAEMLALLGKSAALIAEDMRDPVVIEAVNDVEGLTTNLGRKIWQKITLIPELAEPADAS